MKTKLKTAAVWTRDRFTYFIAAFFAVYITFADNIFIVRAYGVIACLSWGVQFWITRSMQRTDKIRDNIIDTQRETIRLLQEGGKRKDKIIGLKNRQIQQANAAFDDATDQLRIIRADLSKLKGVSNG